MSPDSNASSTTSSAPSMGAVNVQGGASMKEVGVPELGMQKFPPGSAGSQPTAGAGGDPKLNS
jgi:hypothetical protein